MKAYQVLRLIGIDFIENREELFDYITAHKDCIDEVWFFNQSTHDVRAISHTEKFLKDIKPFMHALQKEGIKVGIDVLCTVGHMKEYPDTSFELNHPFNGDKNMGKLCIANSETLKYISELYSKVAAISPDAVYSDDDIDYSFCACEDCMRIFKNDYVKRPELNSLSLDELLNVENKELRRYIRECYIRFNRDRVTTIYKTIEKAVHSVNPDITLGFMTCLEGVNGFGENEWAKALGCEKLTVIHRPGGGAWGDNIDDVAKKSHKIGNQLRFLPKQQARAYTEIENFPGTELSKSRAVTGFETLVYLAAGASGTTFNSVPGLIQSSNYDSMKNFGELFRALKKPSDSIVEQFSQSEPEGIGVIWNAESYAFPDNKFSQEDYSLMFADELYQIGLPICYNPDKLSVFVMNKMAAEHLTNEQLLEALEKGVYMDNEALEVINGRGFSEYTGFKSEPIGDVNPLERDLEHGFNAEKSQIRNARISFGYAPKPTMLFKTNEAAEYLSEMITYGGEPIGFCGGIFQNSLGGRICVWSYAPFNACTEAKRAYQLKNIMKWLSKGKIKAYVKSNRKMMLWCRMGGILLASTSFDDSENCIIAVKSDKNEIEISYFSSNVGLCSGKAVKIGNESGYSLYSLPKLPALSVAWSNNDVTEE